MMVIDSDMTVTKHDHVNHHGDGGGKPTTTRIAPAPADFVSRVILSPIIVP